MAVPPPLLFDVLAAVTGMHTLVLTLKKLVHAVPYEHSLCSWVIMGFKREAFESHETQISPHLCGLRRGVAIASLRNL